MTSILGAARGPPVIYGTMKPRGPVNSSETSPISKSKEPNLESYDDRGRRTSPASDTKKSIEGASPENDVDAEGEGDGVDGHSTGTDEPSRKRRRSRKGLDKKFECPQEGCGKSYSRAEHL